jgi:nucleoside-diphosphate-sugar epimerase
MRLYGLIPESDLIHLLNNSKEQINHFKDCNFIILGSSGFLGRWLSTYLSYILDSGEFQGTVTLITRKKESLNEFSNILNPVNGRIFEFGNIESQNFNYLKDTRTIIVFAATSTTKYKVKNATTEFDPINLINQVLTGVPNHNLTFVHLSSGGIYQKSGRKIRQIPRDFPTLTKSKDQYIREKIKIERWAEKFKKLNNVSVRNPRIFTLYGPGLQLDRNFAISEFVMRARSGLPIQIQGNPRNLRSYLYPTDAILQLIYQFNPLEPIYSQIGSCKPQTILDFATYIANFYGTEIKISNNYSKKLDNYVPSDTPPINEVDFNAGLEKWDKWLKFSNL